MANSFGVNENPSFGRIKKLSLTVGDKSIPLTSMTCVWSLDAGAFCTVVPVVGRKLLPTQGEDSQVDSFLEGATANKPAEVYFQDNVMNSPVKLHTGFPIVSHIETATGPVENTGVLARSIGINSRLDLLSAISPAVRVFFSREVTPKAKKAASAAIASINDGSAVAFFTAGKTIIDVNPAYYIIQLLARLQKTLREAGDQTVDEIQQIDKIFITEDSYNLTDRITGGDKSKMGASLAVQAARRAYTWANTSAYNALLDFSRNTFIHTVPEDITEGTYRLGPTLPLGKHYSRELKLSEILTASRDKNSTQDMIPITQVWVSRVWGGSNDATPTNTRLVDSFDKYKYHRWPEQETVNGNALIKQPPVFFSTICEQKLADGGTGSKKTLVKQSGIKSDGSNAKTSSAETEEEKEKENPAGRTQAEIDTLGEQFAKMYYVEMAYKKQTATLSVPWHLYDEMLHLLGQNIKFTIPFKQGSFIGHLAQVSLTIDRPSVRATCSLSLTHVRTEAENDKLGFDEHPLYNDWIGKRKPELVATTAGSSGFETGSENIV